MTENLYEGLLADFVFDARERLDCVEQSLLRLADAEPLDQAEIFEVSRRELHTLKGNAGMMGFKELQGLAHELENEFEALQHGHSLVSSLLQGIDRYRSTLEARMHASEDALQLGESTKRTHAETEVAEGSIRVPFSALNKLVDLLAEVVVFQNQLRDAIGKGSENASPAQAWSNVGKAEESLGKTLTQLQNSILQLRMVPLGNLFGQLGRIVHDESENTGKKVHFESVGGDTPVDKALLEVASEALGHLVRNAVIHGIEPEAKRRARGKSADGHIRVSARREGNEVQIEVIDDGGGIDREKLSAAATRQGIAVDRENINRLVFVSGLSTRETADLSAGRGVGLSAVADSVRNMNGRIEMNSTEGAGTVFRLCFPLSVSIIRTLILRSDAEEYALPVSAVEESRHFSLEEGHRINQASAISWRSRVISLLDLGYAFQTAAAPRKEGALIVIGSGGKNRGLIVDEVLGIRDVIVKGLDESLESPVGVFGSTILGDGRAILILDPQGLIELPAFVENFSGDSA